MKPHIIKQIEDYYHIELVDLAENPKIEAQVEFNKSENSYSLNEKGQVLKLSINNSPLENLKGIVGISNSITHLSLSSTKIDDIEILSKFENLIYLDLGTNRISNIKPIAKLQQLEFLYLDNNRISDIPALDLPSIQELWLYSNKITDILNLKSLKYLEHLNISSNDIINISCIGFLKDIKHLDLSKNKISDISSLSELKEIFYLNLQSNNIEDISPIRELSIVDELMIGDNKIIDLTPLYISLKNGKIKFINAFQNPLQYPPENVVIRGEYNIVSWFEMIMENAKNLINENKKSKDSILDLGNMGLTNLSLIPEVFELTHLKHLYLSNEWAEFDDENQEWKLIKSVNNIKGNNLYSIPNQITKLINLEVIIIGGDWNSQNGTNKNKWRIKNVDVLFNLKKLTFLNISNNRIENIDKIINLKKLKVIHANNNEIKTFPELNKLTKLREVYLSNNLISDVNFLTNCFQIATIDLHSNQIKNLLPLENLIQDSSLEIKVSSWEKGVISIRNNSKEIIPPYEVIISGKNDFLLYVQQIRFEDKLALPKYFNNDIKIILVGNSFSGKSTFLHYLLTKKINKNLPTTSWLVIKESKQIVINNQTIRLRYFDFGGQDYYHDTHNIFFTTDSIYLLLWDEESNQIGKINVRQKQHNGKYANIELQTFPIEYWLDSIDIFTKATLTKSEIQIQQLLEDNNKNIFDLKLPKTSTNEKVLDLKNILIIQNKVENGKGFIDQKKLIKSYKKIYDYINISLFEKIGLQEFNQHYDQLISNNTNFNKPLLATWGKIKDNFEDIFISDQFYITIPLFTKRINDFLSTWLEEIGKTEDQISSILLDSEEIISLAKYLMNIGIAIFNSENQSNVNTIIIKPHLFLSNVYKILDIAKKNNGVIHTKQTNKIVLDEDILQLLSYYKIIFKDTRSQDYIAPLFLPENPPELINLFIDYDKIPFRRFCYYHYINKNILQEIYSDIEKIIPANGNYYYWKKGLIISNDLKEKVLIKFQIDSEYKKIYIDIINVDNKISDFLFEILGVVKNINSKNKLQHDELLTLDGVFFADYKQIIEQIENNTNMLKLEKFLALDNEQEFIFEKTLKFNPLIPKTEKKPMKKLFVSYSKHDEDYKNEFIKHLITLKDEGLIDEFNCDEIELGDNSHNVIQEELANCDYMIALVSIDFLNTEYIRKFEVQKAKEIGKKIIPIIIKPCDWENSIIKDFHASLRGTNISLDKDLFLMNKIKETSSIERHAGWNNIIKEFRKKLFK
jgi:internalin A